MGGSYVVVSIYIAMELVSRIGTHPSSSFSHCFANYQKYQSQILPASLSTKTGRIAYLTATSDQSKKLIAEEYREF